MELLFAFMRDAVGVSPLPPVANKRPTVLEDRLSFSQNGPSFSFLLSQQDHPLLLWKKLFSSPLRFAQWNYRPTGRPDLFLSFTSFALILFFWFFCIDFFSLFI